jgi:cobalt-zinc-cadmium efflux system protein
MSGMHDHHQHGSLRETGTADRRLLAVSLGLLLAFMVAVVFGILASFAGAPGGRRSHAHGRGRTRLALLAASPRRPAGGRWTFGFGRWRSSPRRQNRITLLLFGLWIVHEAIKRLIDPPVVDAAVVGSSRSPGSS